MNYNDALMEIRKAAEAEFGKEVEIFAEGKRVYVGKEDCCWQLRQIKYPLSLDGVEDSLSVYRLDVLRGDIHSRTIFDLSRDSIEDVIGRKFRALNVSYEEYMESVNG